MTKTLADRSTIRLFRPIGLAVVCIIVSVLCLGLVHAALTQEIGTLPENRKELAEINATLPGLRTERNSLQKRIAQLKVELESLNESRHSVIDEANALSQELLGLQAEETRARGERDRLVKEVNSLSSDRDALQLVVNSLDTRKQSLEGEIERINELVTENTTQLESLRKEEELYRTMQLELPGLQAEEARARAERNRLVKEVDSLRADHDTLQTSVASLVTRKQGLEDDIARNSAALMENAEKLEKLRIEVEQHTKISRELPGLQVEEERARAERDRLMKEVDSLTADRDTLQTSVASLVIRKQGLEDENARVNAALTESSEKLEKLRIDVEQHAKISRELPSLQVEEERASAERYRLMKEVDSLTSDRDTLQTSVTELTMRQQSLKTDRDALSDRIAAQQSRLDELRRLVDENLVSIAQKKDELSLLNQELDRNKADLTETKNLLASRRAELERITDQERVVADRVTRLRNDLTRTEVNLEDREASLSRLNQLEEATHQRIRSLIENLDAAGRTASSKVQPVPQPANQ